MIDKFFGVHPYVIRSGFWKQMKPGEKDLLIYLEHESERCQRLEMTRTDAEVTAVVGVAGRTLCNARKKLQERGLVQCKRGAGNKFTYTICDPTTGEPYPGDQKRPRTCSIAAKKRISNHLEIGVQHMPRRECPSKSSHDNDREQHGVPGIFDDETGTIC